MSTKPSAALTEIYNACLSDEGWAAAERALRKVQAAAWSEGYQHAYVIGAEEGATGKVVEFVAPNPYRNALIIREESVKPIDK